MLSPRGRAADEEWLLQAEEWLLKKTCRKMRSHQLALDSHRKDKIYVVGLENRYGHTNTPLLCSAAAGVFSPRAESQQTLLGGLRSSGHGPPALLGLGEALEPSVEQTQQCLWLFPEETPLVKSLLLTNELKPLCFFFPPTPCAVCRVAICTAQNHELQKKVQLLQKDNT